MRNRKERTEDDRSPVGRQIKANRERKGWTQKELAAKIGVRGVSQETVSKWELGGSEGRFIKAEDVILLATVFGIDCHQLLTGEHPEHMTVSTELGLSDQAISTLRAWTRNALQHPHYTAGLRIDESEEGGAETENIITPMETLETLNLLLENPDGWRLLSLVYRFCFADFDKPTLNGQPINEIVFPNRSSGLDGKTIVNTSLLRFATMKAIEEKLEDLRKNLTEREEAQRNGNA